MTLLKKKTIQKIKKNAIFIFLFKNNTQAKYNIIQSNIFIRGTNSKKS